MDGNDKEINDGQGRRKRQERASDPAKYDPLVYCIVMIEIV